MDMNSLTRILVVSDTHGLIRHELTPFIANADFILHVGDFGSKENLHFFRQTDKLAACVRGNVDRGGWARTLPATDLTQIAGLTFYLIHNLNELDIEPSTAKVDFVLYGHTHQPDHKVKNDVHFLNPGSFGPPRFNLPISLATIEVKKADDQPMAISSMVRFFRHDGGSLTV